MKKKILAFLSIIFFGAITQLMSCPYVGHWFICDTEDLVMIGQLINDHPDCEESDAGLITWTMLGPEACDPE
jgi:hypothetical protein